MLRHSIRLCHLPSTSSFQHHPNTRRFSLSSAIISTSSFLSHSSVTQACQWTLETVHASVGLPWWVTIVGTTVAFKLLTSPLLFASERSLAKYALIKLLVLKRGPEFRAEAEKLAESNALSVDKKRLWIMLAMRKYELMLMKQKQCHPLAALSSSLVHMPVWIGMSYAIRNLSGQNPVYMEYDDAIVDELSSESVMWLPNLIVPDPLYILPMITCVAYLIAPTISMIGSPPMLKTTPFYRILRMSNVVITCYITYIGIHMPAVVTLYWVTSIVTTLALRMILKLPQVRRRLGIDWTPLESETPVQELILRTFGRWKPEPTVKRKPESGRK